MGILGKIAETAFDAAASAANSAAKRYEQEAKRLERSGNLSESQREALAGRTESMNNTAAAMSGMFSGAADAIRSRGIPDESEYDDEEAPSEDEAQAPVREVIVPASKISDTVLKVFAEFYSIDLKNISENTDLNGGLLDVDSLDMVDLVMEIEEALDINIPDCDENTDHSGMHKVKDFIEYINKYYTS